MNITKKFDRAFQWAGEKMGNDAKTSMSDDFKQLEMEMTMRHEGMERLQKSMNAYIKWLGRRGETFDDKEKGLPGSYLGRTMINHGEDFQSDSEFGNCLIAMGRANERVSAIQESFVSEATSTWLESLERSLAMMKEYQAARKKLENRRLAYDASITKMQKAKRDDFRIEEELRSSKAKYEESSEDVVRRMQDIRDAEADSVRDLTRFMDAELEYHERCAEELRRVRNGWAASSDSGGSGYGAGPERRATGRSRLSPAPAVESRMCRKISNTYEPEEEQPEPQPARMPIRSTTRLNATSPSYLAADEPTNRPSISRASTVHVSAGADRDRDSERTNGRSASSGNPMASYGVNQNIPNVGLLRGQLRPVNARQNDVFADRDDETASSAGSPEYGERSASPATSYGSVSRSAGNAAVGARKAPPPPPPSRSKKPPPIPAKREVGY